MTPEIGLFTREGHVREDGFTPSPLESSRLCLTQDSRRTGSHIDLNKTSTRPGLRFSVRT